MTATATPTTTTFGILGLLSLGPMSRYDVAQLAEQSIGNFWNIAKSQVYGELTRLEELGYVKGKAVRQPKLPDKTVFEVTKKGQSAMKEWLESKEIDDDKLRSEFLLRVFFAGSMSETTLAELIESYQEDAEKDLFALRQITEYLESEPRARFQRYTALLGLEISEAKIRWTNKTLKELPKRKGTKR